MITTNYAYTFTSRHFKLLNVLSHGQESLVSYYYVYPTAPILIVLSTLYLRPLLLSLPALPPPQPLPLSSAEDSKNGLQVISSWQAPVPAAAVLHVWFLAHFLHSDSTVASVLPVLLFLLGIGRVVFCLTGIFPICSWA